MLTPDIVWHEGELTREQRWQKLRTKGATLWLTGLSASGKSTIAAAIERLLVERGVSAYRLDGDNIRHGLSSNLGFSAADRAENIRRIGEVAKLFADSGAIAIASFISPYREDRDLCRKLHSQSQLPFFEVFIDTPLEVCEARDPKGMYRRARKGEIKNFTGISDPYEAPLTPELVVKAGEWPLAQCAEACLALLDLAPDAAAR